MAYYIKPASKLSRKDVGILFGKIYKITNLVNGKIYVGQTQRDVEQRFKEHMRADSLIGKAICKYGLKNFKCEILEECDTIEELNEREIFWIKELNCKVPNGYNLTDGGHGVAGHPFTEEHKAKIAAALKGQIITAEQRNKISATLKIYYAAHPEARKRISERQKNLSPEAKANMSKSHKGKKLTLEHRAKISRSLIGNQNHKGKKASEVTRKKMSETRKGRKFSPEHRAKISATHKALAAKKREQANK